MHKNIYFFTANWCGACKGFKPVVENILKDRDNINYTVINVEDNHPLILKYKVRALPTIIIEDDDGNTLGIIQGANLKLLWKYLK